MTDRPIPMNEDMVRALLEGRKTQTRRVINPQPYVDDMGNFRWNRRNFGQDSVGPKVQAIASPLPCSKTKHVLCRHGGVGDRFYVRETARVLAVRGGIREIDIEYQADGTIATVPYPSRLAPAPLGKCLANGTYREASRILLEIGDVRVERLQAISKDDALAEGLKGITKDGKLVKYGIPDRDGYPGTDNTGWAWDQWCVNPVDAYKNLWKSIYGHGSWDANPWVWRISFERIAS